MYRSLLLLLFSPLLVVPVGAQVEQNPPDEQQEAAGPEVDAEDDGDTGEAEEVSAEEQQIDETGLDDQGYTDEDDDFRPSEDIPADQSIPFPTDI